MATFTMSTIRRAQRTLRAFESWRASNPAQWATVELMAAKMADGGRRVRINRLISAAQVRGFDIQRNWASAIGRTLAVERGIAVAQRPTVFDVMI